MKIQKPEQTIKLSNLSGIAYKIAEYNLKEKGFYFCIIGGIRTEVIK